MKLALLQRLPGIVLGDPGALLDLRDRGGRLLRGARLLLGAPVDLVYEPSARPRIQLREARVASLLGESVSTGEIAKLLDSVGSKVGPGLTVAGALFRKR